jgi:hypothetical protein
MTVCRRLSIQFLVGQPHFAPHAGVTIFGQFDMRGLATVKQNDFAVGEHHLAMQDYAEVCDRAILGDKMLFHFFKIVIGLIKGEKKHTDSLALERLIDRNRHLFESTQAGDIFFNKNRFGIREKGIGKVRLRKELPQRRKQARIEIGGVYRYLVDFAFKHNDVPAAIIAIVEQPIKLFNILITVFPLAGPLEYDQIGISLDLEDILIGMGNDEVVALLGVETFVKDTAGPTFARKMFEEIFGDPSRNALGKRPHDIALGPMIDRMRGFKKVVDREQVVPIMTDTVFDDNLVEQLASFVDLVMRIVQAVLPDDTVVAFDRIDRRPRHRIPDNRLELAERITIVFQRAMQGHANLL